VQNLSRIPLARLPTPIERLDRPSARLGVEVWVKRDDLTGLALSGNKVRKLEYLMAAAEDRGCTAVITCGGIQSNHARATAFSARRLGMQPHLMLRETDLGARSSVDGNLLLDAIIGAQIRWVDPDGYRERESRMAAWAGELEASGERVMVIPEGGSNGLGAMGYVHAMAELAAQTQDLFDSAAFDSAAFDSAVFDSIVVAVGSGGTLAGMAMGVPEGTRVLGINVCDDRAHFVARVLQIAAEAGRSVAEPGTNWDVVEGFEGRGYALTTAEELQVQVRFARETGLLLDPVYTGKAWVALEALARQGRLGKRVLFWHTGGAFGLFGRGAEITEALPDRVENGFGA